MRTYQQFNFIHKIFQKQRLSNFFSTLNHFFSTLFEFRIGLESPKMKGENSTRIDTMCMCVIDTVARSIVKVAHSRYSILSESHRLRH